MATCKNCGAILPEGTKFCSECGAPVENDSVRTFEPTVSVQTEKQRRKRKPLFRRVWIWLLIAAVAASLYFRSHLLGKAAKANPTGSGIESLLPTSKPTAKPTEAPVETEAPTLADALIRPEVKEALDSYEAYMDEYIAFMERYKAADSSETFAMMSDYSDMLSRYAEFAEKIDALGESELTNAELAYYLEVTNRVSQKLLNAAG